MKSLFTFLFLLIFTPLLSQTRYYVDGTASGQNNGTDWANAFTNLHDALALALAGDEVWVAQGTYRTTSGTDRSIRFELPSGVRLYGGFSGTEMVLEERDWATYPTILDGDIGAVGDSLDNTYNLMYALNPDSSTLIDGLVFRYGQADYPVSLPGGLGSNGAGLLMLANGASVRLKVRNCIFDGNYARLNGGAVYASNAHNEMVKPVFEHCVFRKNSARFFGAAVARDGGGNNGQDIDFLDCAFKENIIFVSGCVYISNAPESDTTAFKSCIVEKNRFNFNATSVQRAVFLGIDKQGTQRNFIQMDSCLISGNIKTSSAYGVVANGLYFNFEPNSVNIYFDFSNSIFSDTLSSFVLWESSSIGMNGVLNHYIQNCAFEGFGMLSLLPPAHYIQVRNSTFNMVAYPHMDPAFSLAAGFYSSQNSILDMENIKIKSNVPIWGPVAAFYAHADSINIRNVTMQQGHLVVEAGHDSVAHKITISNSLFDTEALPITLGQVFNIPSSFEVVYRHNLSSGIEPGYTADWVKSGNIWGVDPKMTDDLKLLPCSPAINAGNSDLGVSLTDLLGNPRVRHGQVDMGTYETLDLKHLGEPSVTPTCPGGTSGTAGIGTISDACPPLQYVWSHLPGMSSPPALGNLAPGPYTVTIIDSKGRTISVGMTVPVWPIPSVTPLAQPVACGAGAGGTAACAVSGTPPFQYAWEGYAAVSDSILSPVGAGFYKATVTDGHGCTATTTVEVDHDGFLNIGFEQQDITCTGGNDGWLLALPGNAAEPLTWHWGDGTTFPGISGLSAGTYFGTLTDGWGCAISWQLSLSDPLPITATALVTDATTVAAQDGRIQLLPTGGTGSLQVVWSNGQSGPVISGLPVGSYTATVTDANGCTAMFTSTVSYVSGTQENMPTVAVNLSPNPFGDHLIVGIGEGTKAGFFRVVDGLGRTVLATQLSAGVHRWDTTTWLPGSYFWFWENGGSAQGILVKHTF